MELLSCRVLLAHIFAMLHFAVWIHLNKIVVEDCDRYDHAYEGSFVVSSLVILVLLDPSLMPSPKGAVNEDAYF